MINFKYKAVVFDLDGTLLDTLTDLTDTDNYTLSFFGFPPVTREQVRSYMGNGIKQLIRLSVPGGENNPRFDEAYALYLKRYLSHADDNTEPYDGVVSLLTTLKDGGVKTAVVSNKNHIATEELCKKHFGELIDVAIGENEAAGVRKKPCPDTVFEALKILGEDKSGAVYVGDTEVDIETAKNCGMKCVCVSWGFRDKDVLIRAGAENIADNSPELLKIFLKK